MTGLARGSDSETNPNPEAGRGDSYAELPVRACSGRFLQRSPTQQGDTAGQRRHPL